MTNTKTYGVAIVGCGKIGVKRAHALASAKLAACVDTDLSRAESLAGAFPGVEAFTAWKEVIGRAGIDILVVATTNDRLAEITLAAIQAGQHVLVEKPAARNLAELQRVFDASKESDALVRVGFNHRYHPALQKAKTILEEEDLGPIMMLRGRYGHGGRVGYEQEWRADPVVSGGGELLDQGVHLIDLARFFMGEFPEVTGSAHTYFWDMEVDDNAFLLLKTGEGRVASLHVSCTEWKNLFSLEIYAERGKLHVDGLGGSYGVERLAFYRMLPEMGPPETTTWEYPMADRSWLREFEEFIEDINLGRSPSAGLPDALATLKVVDEIYKLSGYKFQIQ